MGACGSKSEIEQGIRQERTEMKKAPITLDYFAGHGRAAQIRIILEYCNKPYNDNLLSQEEYQQNRLEGKYPLNAVPVVFVQGHVLAQTWSIIRLLARTNKGRNGETLYPGTEEDPMLMYEMDVILDNIDPHTDYVAKFMHPAFGIAGDEVK